jgi:hypothetical protein
VANIKYCIALMDVNISRREINYLKVRMSCLIDRQHQINIIEDWVCKSYIFGGVIFSRLQESSSKEEGNLQNLSQTGGYILCTL